MTLNYTLSKKDFAALCKYLQKRGRRFSRAATVQTIIFILLGGLTYFAISEFSRSSDFFSNLPVSRGTVLLGVIAALFVLYVFYLRPHYLEKSSSAMISEDGPFVGDFSIELTSDGLRVTGRHFRTEYSWNAFRSVEENKNYLYLILDNAAGMQIPTDAFSSENEKRDFVAQVSARTVG